MSTPKAITDARASVRALEATLAEHDARIKAREDALIPARKRLATARARQAKVPVLIKSTAGIQLGDLTALSVSPYGAIKDGEKERAFRTRLEAGEAKVTINGGNEFSPRSIPLKMRRVSPETLRVLAAHRRKVQRAADALERATLDQRTALNEAFEIGDKVLPADVIADVAKVAILRRDARSERGYNSADYEAGRIRDYQLPTARKHLDHALTRSKDPCPCSSCVSERTNARWKAEQAERAKAAAKAAKAEARAEERRRAKAPKVEIVCPNAGDEPDDSEDCHHVDDNEGFIQPDADGNVWSPAIVVTENRTRFAECDVCGALWNIATLLSRPVGDAPGQTTIIAA